MFKNYSVLMSLYDKENPKWFEISLKSMLNQTIQPDEIVLVLDGPINNNLNSVIDKYAQKHPKILRVIPLPENLGLGLALNKGLEYCQNELVARMDTDDISKTDRCEKQLKIFNEKPELSIVGTNIDEFYEDCTNVVSSRQVPAYHDEIISFLKRRSPFNHPTVMYKKSEVLRVGGYNDLLRAEDLDLFSRMLSTGSIGYNINESLYLYRADQKNYKRRKSWINVRENIRAHYNIYKRGESSVLDFIIVTASFLGMYIVPLSLFKKINDSYLRNNYKK